MQLLSEWRTLLLRAQTAHLRPASTFSDDQPFTGLLGKKADGSVGSLPPAEADVAGQQLRNARLDALKAETDNST
jgi:hypothetical protein